MPKASPNLDLSNSDTFHNLFSHNTLRNTTGSMTIDSYTAVNREIIECSGEQLMRPHRRSSPTASADDPSPRKPDET